MQNYLNEVQSMDTLLKPLAKPLQEIQHQKPLWKEQEECREDEVPEHYWLPTRAEQGVPYEAQTHAPPDPSRPPKFPSYPSPRDLHRQDVEAHQKILDAVEERKAARQAALAAKRVRNDRPDKGADPNYDSRMAMYKDRPAGEGLGGEDDPAARFDDSSTLDLFPRGATTALPSPSGTLSPTLRFISVPFGWQTQQAADHRDSTIGTKAT